MMRRFKKPVLILLLALCVLGLAGWGQKAVELLDDTPLIDLDAAIKEAPIGNQGNTAAAQEHEAEKKAQYIISVRDRTITYERGACDSVDALREKIIRDCGGGAGSVYLVDDYAEAHVYRDVLAILKQLQETMGLEYVYE